MKRGVCVVYFDHPLGLCLVFCSIPMPITLLTMSPLLSSALKEKPFSGVESGRQSPLLCRPVLWWTEGIRAAGWGRWTWSSASSLWQSLIHLGWILAENLRYDKAQLCLCDPAHWVLSFYRCVEKVGMEQAKAGLADYHNWMGTKSAFLTTAWSLFCICFRSTERGWS